MEWVWLLDHRRRDFDGWFVGYLLRSQAVVRLLALVRDAGGESNSVKHSLVHQTVNVRSVYACKVGRPNQHKHRKAPFQLSCAGHSHRVTVPKPVLLRVLVIVFNTDFHLFKEY
jgi:hypothetical protein